MHPTHFSSMKQTLLLLTVIYRLILCSSDNPTALVPPLNVSDPGYIIAESNGGLANRLRVLAAYMHVSRVKYDTAHLVFVWDINDACPGHFLQLFNPIESVIFSPNASRPALEPHAKASFPNSRANMEAIFMEFDIPRRKPGFPTWGEIHERMYSRFVPTREIMAIVREFVDKHHVCNASAMHIRSTDLERLVGKKKSGNMNARNAWISGLPEGETVFLLTDNPEIQRQFIDRHKPKVFVYCEIPEARLQRPLNGSQPAGFEQVKEPLTVDRVASLLPEEHRFTTLEHTLIDVLIAAHAKLFRGSPFSSLSELVAGYARLVEARGWCPGRSKTKRKL